MLLVLKWKEQLVCFAINIIKVNAYFAKYNKYFELSEVLLKYKEAECVQYLFLLLKSKIWKKLFTKFKIFFFYVCEYFILFIIYTSFAALGF